TSARPGESEALDVLAHILGRGENSRLYEVLVVDKAIAVNAGANYDGTAVDNTRLSVYATPKPEVSLPQLEGAIDVVLADDVENGGHRGRARALQEPDDRRRDLRQRQSAGAGAVVWLLARNRRERRASAHLARSHPAGQRTGGAGCSPPLARQAPLGDRVSRQGRPGPRGTLANASTRPPAPRRPIPL